MTNVGASDELILVTGDITSTGVITIDGGKKIILVSQGADRVITKSANNINLFKIEDLGSELVLGDPDYSAYKLELDGNSLLYSGESLVQVETSGTLTIKANAILRNNKNNSNGGGVYCDSGTVSIEGGKISDNIIESTTTKSGGGIYALNSSTIQMNSGTIDNNNITTSGTANTGAQGGGISLTGSSNFEMSGGVIENNSLSSQSSGSSAYVGGGGVNIDSGLFNMIDGTIRNNIGAYDTAINWDSARGGGVGMGGTAVFTMSGGVISGNVMIAELANHVVSGYGMGAYGGGVYLEGATATFTKTGGTIYGNEAVGNDADGFPLKNRVMDGGTDIFTAADVASPPAPYKSGHAVLIADTPYQIPQKWREGTSGPGDGLDSALSGAAGGWEP
jgi:hypothetical protein